MVRSGPGPRTSGHGCTSQAATHTSACASTCAPRAARVGGTVPHRGIAQDLRDLLDERFLEGTTLAEAARSLHAHPTHLVRTFSAAFGIAPHQYVTPAASTLPVVCSSTDGHPGEVATAAGFYDQSHLTRHFKRLLGITPGHYARTGAHRLSRNRPRSMPHRL
jgi:AraC-like DNA-binding protein